MAIRLLIAGGLSNGGSPYGILGRASGGTLTETATNPPQTGVKGWESGNGAANTIQMPNNTGVNACIAADASRTFIAVYGEYTYASAVGGTGFAFESSSSERLCVIYFGTTINRQLVLLSVTDSTIYENGTDTAVDATSLTHVGAFAGSDYSGGRYYVLSGGFEAQIVSNTDDVLTVASWYGGTPAVGTYTVRKYQFQYQVWDNTNAVIASGTKFDPDFDAHDQIEFYYSPNDAGAERVKVVRNGSVDINATGGTAGDETLAVKIQLSTTSTGKTTSWTGTFRFWNGVVYDNIDEPSGSPWAAFPQTYVATVADRPYIAYRVPIAGTPQYDQWGKSAGSDAYALLDEADEDGTDYIDETTSGERQSWISEALSSMAKPIYNNTTTDPVTIYAVQTIGMNNSATKKDVICKHYYGSSLDAGRVCGVEASANPFLYCGHLQPDGTAWTYVAADGTQSVAECGAGGGQVSVSRQLVLAVGGRAAGASTRRRFAGTVI